MNKEQVAEVVQRVAYDLEAEGKTPYDVYIVNPMYVWRRIEDTEPAVAQHLKRFYRGDPYQQIKVWMPRRSDR